MKIKNYVFYDNYDLDDFYEDAKQELIDNYDNEDPSESEIWDEIYRMDEFNRDDAYEELGQIFNNGKFLAVGTCGRWNGTFSGGFIFENLKELMGYFTDCAYIKIWMENNHFFVKGTHHDGVDEVEVKEITKRGEGYYDNWSHGTDNRTERGVHRKMFTNSHYTHLIKSED